MGGLFSRSEPAVVQPQIRNPFAIGTTSVVYHTEDPTKVIKKFISADKEERLQTEIEAYNILGDHAQIATFFGVTADKLGIFLERGSCLRKLLQEKTICPDEGIKLCSGLAAGLQHIHSKDVVHADVGCHNVILDDRGQPKYIDFEGCSINGQLSGSCYEWCSYRPSEPEVSKATDIFAFGCMLYEIEEGEPPFHEETIELGLAQKMDYVSGKYSRDEYPDTTQLKLGPVIRKCWLGELHNMEQVCQDIDAILDTTAD